MEAYIALIVILFVVIFIFFTLMVAIREGIVFRKISAYSVIILLAFWNPAFLIKLLIYSPEIFRSYIFVSVTLYISTLLIFEVFQKQKDTYTILGFNFGKSENSSRVLVEDTLTDLNIPHETGVDFTLINGSDKISYYKKEFTLTEIRDTDLKMKIKKGMAKRLTNKITFSSVLYSLLSAILLSFYLREAIKLFLYTIN